MTTHHGQIALGTMYLGTRQDQDRSFAILDRFVELGGRWLDTADNYAFWQDASERGGASERMLGAWLRARPGMRERVWISTKVGADPMVPGRWPETMEGLGPEAIAGALERSLDRLGTDHVELYWAHVEDRTVPLEDQVGAFGSLVADGLVGRVGASNHALWRVERARRLALDLGMEPFSAVQLRHTYLQPVPFAPLPDTGHVVASPEALDYVASEDVAFWSYSALLSGAYTHGDRLQSAYRHPDTVARLSALTSAASSVGATVNQVVLAWLLGSTPAVTPIVGVSDVAQLDEVMAARDLVLDEQTRIALDGAART